LYVPFLSQEKPEGKGTKTLCKNTEEDGGSPSDPT